MCKLVVISNNPSAEIAVCNAIQESVGNNPEGLKVFIWIFHKTIVGFIGIQGMNDAANAIAKKGMSSFEYFLVKTYPSQRLENLVKKISFSEKFTNYV